MATAVTTYTTQTRHVAYITNQQFKLAPIPTAWDSLVSGGSPPENEDQLTQMILRGSTWIDSICMQVLAATIDTEQRIADVNRYGQIIISPRYHPVIQLTDFWSGVDPLSMAQMASLANTSVEPNRFIVSPGGVPYTSNMGPLQFGGPVAGPSGYPLFVRYSYLNGYPVTTLTEPADANAMSITVKDSTGVLANFTPLSLRDGAPSEPLSIASVSGNVLQLNSPLANAHQAGAAVTALPPDVEEAVALATSGLAKLKGNAAIVVNSTQPIKTGSDPLGAASDLALAESILTRGDYVRVV